VPELELQYEDLAGQPQTVYIVFADRPDAPRIAPWWVRIFTCPDFRHVYAIKQQTLGIVILDPVGLSVRVSWYPIDAEDAARKIAALPHHRVVRLDTVYPEAYRVRGLITCVSVVKAMAGVTGWRIITPYQLYRWLLRSADAQEIKADG
jgi:hypothetical protein